jgi:outer membrane protein TolC
MDSPNRPRPRTLRRLAWRLALAGTPWLGLGCAGPAGEVVRAGLDLPVPPGGVQAAPAPEVVQASHAEAAPAPAEPAKELPITLDTVLRLAEGQNAQVGVARERLNESLLRSQMACGGWLPKVFAGVAYYRHEGGIQNEDGTLTHSSTGALYPGLQIQTELDLRESTYQCVNAQRQVWQRKAEVARITNENLLEAANTYIDLLAARRGEAVARELDGLERKLLDRAERLAREEVAAEALVEAIRASRKHRETLIARLRQQGNSASAKLVYLLGLPPCTLLVPVDAALAPFELADASPPCCELVSQALAAGPGVREMEGLLATIQNGIAQAQSPAALLPTFQMNVFEGAFGAGPGDRLDWDNRLDVGLQARWNLTQLFTAREQLRLARSGLAQAQLSYADLRGKLALGVEDARESILSGRERIGLATTEIQHASETYKRTTRRLEESAPGASIREVLLSISALEQAHYDYITSITTHNKGQVRLMLLLGPAAGKPPAPADGHPAVLPEPCGR